MAFAARSLMLVRRGWVAVIGGVCLLTAAFACQRRGAKDGPKDEPRGTTTLRAAELLRAKEPLPNVVDDPDRPIACASLRDQATSELVRVEGPTLFYADSTAGLTVVDVADAARPQVLATVRFVGTPIALFVREGVAWLVFIDWDSRFAKGVETVVRAIDVRDPHHPVVLGDEARDGTGRDAKLVGGLLYLLRREADHTALESFGLRAGALRSLDTLYLDGIPAQLGASPAGLAVVSVHTAVHEGGPDATTRARRAGTSSIAWIDLPLDGGGGLVLRDSVVVPGTVATWERGDAETVDADEGQVVRVVTCASPACSPTGGATLRVIDFAAESPARAATSLRLTERGGLPVTRFTDGLLYVAEPARRPDASVVHVVRTSGRVPAFIAHLPIRGEVAGLVVHESSLVALGTIGTPESQVKMVLQEIDVEKPAAPRLRANVAFGSDWTWSAALDDENALSFDPASRVVAVPVTMWRAADRRYVTGAEVIDLGHDGAQRVATVRTDGFVERTVFVGSHLVGLGPETVQAVDYVPATDDASGQQ